MRIRLPLPALAAAAVATGVAGAALADQGAIEHRQAIMKAVGGHTAATAAIVKGKVPFTGDVKGHAHALVELAKIAGNVFPPESAKGESDTLPAVWEKPEAFKKSYQAFVDAADALAKAAEGDDPKAVAGALGNLGKSCKGCHDDFRKKK